MTSEQRKGAAFQTPRGFVTSFRTFKVHKNPQFTQAGDFSALGILCPFLPWFLNLVLLRFSFSSRMPLMFLFRLSLCDIQLSWTLTFCNNPNTIYFDRAWKRFIFGKWTPQFIVFLIRNDWVGSKTTLHPRWKNYCSRNFKVASTRSPPFYEKE